jgi:hypothetical protein
VPVAVKLTVFGKPPTEELAGATAIDCSNAAVTVKFVVAETPSKVAVIVAVPAARPVASPLLMGSLLILAKPEESVLQLASVVKSCVVESEKVPVAVNWVVSPVAMDGAAGEIVILVTVAALTVSV